MFSKIQDLTDDVDLRHQVIDDFSTLLLQVGLPEVETGLVIKKFIELLDKNISQSAFEDDFRKFIFSIKVGEATFKDMLEDLYKRRSERIYSEIVEFIDTKNKVLDFGCGNALVGQLLSDKNNLIVEGCDVVVYSGPDIKIKINKFDGYHLDVANNYFEIGYANSVLHHDEEPSKVIGEITRVVSKRFILIEDTLQGKTDDEIASHSKRLFINDYIYNRLLTESDIPIPTTYNIADDWIELFSKCGWKLSKRDELGWSKILPAVFRERFIFEKNS